MASGEKKQDSVNVNLQRALIVLSAIGTLLMIGWLLKYSAYGIDFTDESFYLVWISNPFIYDFSRTQFGFVYHPLYRLLGGNIAALRQANSLISFGLAWGLVYTFLVSLVPWSKESRVVLHTVSAGLATSVFMLFVSWLLTPSYNSLALQALLITGTGLLLAEKTLTRKSILGWITIGAGGWLAFMAKPSTALALAVGVLICLVISRKFSVRLFLLAAASFAIPLLVSAMLIDGTPWEFVKRFKRGMEVGQILTDKLSQIFRIDNVQLDKKTRLAVFLVFSMLFIAIWSMWSKNKKWLFVGLTISSTFFIVTAFLIIGKIYPAADFGQFRRLLIFGVVFAAVLAGATFGRTQGLKSITTSQWAIAGLFLAMPHIYAFGTGNNYWYQGSSAAIFWLLAGLTLLAPLVRERASWVLLLPLVLATQAVTAMLLQTGVEHPYRQPQPLRLNDTIQEIGPEKSVLLLSAGYAAYLDSAAATARDAGFEPTTSVIDLSGQSPGILFALGAKSIGQPWTLGGYPGSLRFLEAGLSRFSCGEIASAWVLFEPDGPLSISAELMPSLGAEFPGGYRLVGAWHTAKGAGGFAASRIQELYKPVKPQETQMACEMQRSKVAK